MSRRAKDPQRLRAAVLASMAVLGTMVALVATQGSAGASSYKPFSVVICYPGQTCAPASPPVVSPAASAASPDSVTATIADETTKGGGLQIGSVNLTAPAGVMITGASYNGTIPACTASTPASTSCINNGSLLELRSLSVAPHTSIAVSLSLSTPAPSATSCTTTAPCAFTAAAKQSNDYSGPPGNNLNLDSANSQLGIVTTSDTACAAGSGKKGNTCSASLGDGGASGSPDGTVSFTTSATGTNAGTFYESIDYGSPLTNCGTGFDTLHSEYINGVPSGRTFTVTVTTTNFQNDPTFGTYQAELCAQTSMPFYALDTATNPPSLQMTTMKYPEPDGTSGYEGLLPDCSSNPNAQAPTVNAKSYPCVLLRSPYPVKTDGSQPTHTMVASYPANFDSLRQSN